MPHHKPHHKRSILKKPPMLSLLDALGIKEGSGSGCSRQTPAVNNDIPISIAITEELIRVAEVPLSHSVTFDDWWPMVYDVWSKIEDGAASTWTSGRI